mmetsp:Transcript_11052/g.23338  ORF Transcript_11052/g.23338 Transcript_11052/m.23338 type:complete len:153 (+) Transcript_11052:524-982(+)
MIQYSKRRSELLAAGVKLVIVSIGLPEKGKALCEHLGIENGEEFVFVDPENSLYDDLDLNRGVGATFFNPATPLAFKDRLFREGGMFSSELMEVMGKWKDAFYIPPRQDQAFNQGGAFVFDNDKTVYAHYDEATAAHARPEEMVDLALAAKQ